MDTNLILVVDVSLPAATLNNSSSVNVISNESDSYCKILENDSNFHSISMVDVSPFQSYSTDDSIFRLSSWMDGTLRFHYISSKEFFSVGNNNDEWDVIQPHKKIVGVLGICYCPSLTKNQETIELAYQRFTSQVHKLPYVLVSKCCFFQVSEDQLQNEQGSILKVLKEGCDIFPANDAGNSDEQKTFHLSLATSNMCTSLMESYENMIKEAVSLLNQIDSGSNLSSIHDPSLCKIFSGSPTYPGDSFSKEAISSLTTAISGQQTPSQPSAIARAAAVAASVANTQNLTSGSTAKKRKRISSRLRVWIGCHCLLAGRKPDACFYFDAGEKGCKSLGDLAWQGVALEGQDNFKDAIACFKKLSSTTQNAGSLLEQETILQMARNLALEQQKKLAALEAFHTIKFAPGGEGEKEKCEKGMLLCLEMGFLRKACLYAFIAEKYESIAGYFGIYMKDTKYQVEPVPNFPQWKGAKTSILQNMFQKSIKSDDHVNVVIYGVQLLCFNQSDDFLKSIEHSASKIAEKIVLPENVVPWRAQFVGIVGSKKKTSSTAIENDRKAFLFSPFEKSRDAKQETPTWNSHDRVGKVIVKVSSSCLIGKYLSVKMDCENDGVGIKNEIEINNQILNGVEIEGCVDLQPTDESQGNVLINGCIIGALGVETTFNFPSSVSVNVLAIMKEDIDSVAKHSLTSKNTSTIGEEAESLKLIPKLDSTIFCGDAIAVKFFVGARSWPSAGKGVTEELRMKVVALGTNGKTTPLSYTDYAIGGRWNMLYMRRKAAQSAESSSAVAKPCILRGSVCFLKPGVYQIIGLVTAPNRGAPLATIKSGVITVKGEES